MISLRRDPRPGLISVSPLARDLIRIGDEAIVLEDGAKLRAYFAEDAHRSRASCLQVRGRRRPFPLG